MNIRSMGRISLAPFIALLLSLAALAPWPVAAADSGQADTAVAKPAKPVPPEPRLPFAPRPGHANIDPAALQKVGPGLYSLGDLQISTRSKTITLPAVVNMSKGLLEYLLVRNGGKTHESLFRTNVEPVQLNLAMLLIGAEGTDRPLSRQGDPDTPKGNPVEIGVHYLKDGRMVPVKPEAWIWRKEQDKMTESGPMSWVFTGSVMQGGRFLAQAEGSMVAIFHDPAALIDNPTPGGESDRIWFVNEGAVPPVGTPVTVTIRLKN